MALPITLYFLGTMQDLEFLYLSSCSSEILTVSSRLGWLFLEEGLVGLTFSCFSCTIWHYLMNILRLYSLRSCMHLASKSKKPLRLLSPTLSLIFPQRLLKSKAEGVALANFFIYSSISTTLGESKSTSKRWTYFSKTT